MATNIVMAGQDGALEVTGDGEVIYKKPDAPETEVMTADEAMRRWPAAAAQIRQALISIEKPV